ncbi:MAG: hypothetical protein AAGD14_18005 [Planctomycetota bacterium]
MHSNVVHGPVAVLVPPIGAGLAVGLAVHLAFHALPVAAFSAASPLLLLLLALVVLAPALFVRGPWPRSAAFVAAYTTALLAQGVPAWLPLGGA